MKNSLIKLAVLSALGFAGQAMATGLVALPTTGFTTTAGTNQTAGTSAYTRCYTGGNYGSGTDSGPTTTVNNTCAVFPANINTSPVSGYSLKQSATTSLTGNGGEALATMNQRVFRNTANTSCIYGKSFSMATTTTYDYNPARAGTNTLEVNDFAFGGFSATSTVSAGYYYLPSSGTSASIYRVGRAYTSVQTHSDGSGGLASGYIHQPLNSPAPASGTEINGVGQVLTTPQPVPTAAQQTAEIRSNWVDFTTDVTGGADEDDGNPAPYSSMMYVQADCNSTAAAALTNSVILRQTGQETQPWITIKTSGLARSGANANF